MDDPRTILITGASKGIGLALARRLASAGHSVIGVARSGAPDFPGQLCALDMGDRDAERRLREIVERHTLDGVVNNVGLVRPQALHAVDLATLEEVLRVNLHPALAAVQSALPGMTARGWGRIVNVSSLTILSAVELTAYAAAKAALVSFTRSWALELAETGVTVNAVAAGPTETELFRANNPSESVGEAR